MTTETIQEPKKIATLITTSSKWQAPSSWEDWDFLVMISCPNLEEWKAKAPLVDRDCPHCGKTEKWNAIEKASMKAVACEKCYEAHMRGQTNPEKQREQEEILEKIIPPLYRETDRKRLEREHSVKQVRDALAWERKEKGKGLLLVGDTRTGKTRTLCLLLEKLIKEGKTIKAFFHGGFYDEMMEVIRSERAFRKWKAEIVKADILVIDDLFSEKLTERGEASLFEIIDARICFHKPTLLTSQVTQKETKERFHSPARYEAFFSRIKEFFELIRCGKPIQRELQVE